MNKDLKKSGALKLGIRTYGTLGHIYLFITKIVHEVQQEKLKYTKETYFSLLIDSLLID